MLNLTRYPGEKIIVTHEPTGDKIIVHVQSISFTSKWVRIGIDAAKCFLIDREEIYQDAGGHIDRLEPERKSDATDTRSD